MSVYWVTRFASIIKLCLQEEKKTLKSIDGKFSEFKFREREEKKIIAYDLNKKY